MREIEKRLVEAKKNLNINPGDIYEDCAYHPVLCVGVNYETGDIWGVSFFVD